MPISFVDKNDIRSLLSAYADEPGTIILETNKSGDGSWRSFAFMDPERIISCMSTTEIDGALCEIEKEVNRGRYAAGYIAYEAAYAFQKFDKYESNDLPLLWFGIYPRAEIVEKASAASRRKPEPLPIMTIRNPRLTQNREEYIKVVNKIKEYLAAGDTYQVNYTLKLLFDIDGSPCDLYEILSYQQHVRYAGYLNIGQHVILSLSPELFFRMQGNHIVLRPMKGTIRRGRTRVEDAVLSEQLRRSEKDKSENLMIVDLLRNDVGRIAEIGTVETNSLYDIEQYDTLFQMVSTIEAERRQGTTLPDIVHALFPSGSVTGAPKIRTMEIIHEIESSPRGVYTGAIGLIGPDNQAIFNVAIRTLVINRETKSGVMGIGSGIVNDSVAEKEYDECLLKAKFLTHPIPEFQLLETILWEPRSGYFLLDYHLERLFDSALYFDIPIQIDKVKKHIVAQSHKFGNEPRRVRLTVSFNGSYSLQSSPIEEKPEKVIIRFSDVRTDSTDRFLYHKTTNRNLYDRELEQARNEGFFDVLFRNEYGDVTEGSITNIFIRKKNEYITPPLRCGVLDGIFRRHLIRSKIIPLKEHLITEKDVRTAEDVFLCNSVRGIIKVDEIK